MSYEPRLQRNAADKILAYLRETYPRRDDFLWATDEVRVALLNLATNPRQGVAPPGLFEDRPVYRFALRAGGGERVVQVCFCYDSEDPGERTILITDFKPVDDG